MCMVEPVGAARWYRHKKNYKLILENYIWQWTSFLGGSGFRYKIWRQKLFLETASFISLRYLKAFEFFQLTTNIIKGAWIYFFYYSIV